jgi:hypothetical protein
VIETVADFLGEHRAPRRRPGDGRELGRELLEDDAVERSVDGSSRSRPS